MNSCDGSEHLCLLRDLRGKSFNLLALSKMLTGFVIYNFYSYLFCCRFYHKNMLNLVKWFLSASVEPSMFSVLLLMWYVAFIDWCMYHIFIFDMNPTCSWCVIFLIYCWIWFIKVLLIIFCICVHQKYWSVTSFPVTSFSGFRFRVMLAS